MLGLWKLELPEWVDSERASEGEIGYVEHEVAMVVDSHTVVDPG